MTRYRSHKISKGSEDAKIIDRFKLFFKLMIGVDGLEDWIYWLCL